MNGNNNGIIQKIFEPYLVELHEIVCECRQEDNNSEYAKNYETQLDKLMKIQKELIEEIRKGITTDFLILNIGHSLIAQHTAEDIRRKLIGDNQD